MMQGRHWRPGYGEARAMACGTSPISLPDFRRGRPCRLRRRQQAIAIARAKGPERSPGSQDLSGGCLRQII